MHLIKNTKLQYCVLFLLAIITGIFGNAFIIKTASIIADNFILLFKWCSIPIIFLSILSITSGLRSYKELFKLGKYIFKYTIITTILAASIALNLFIILNPTTPSLFNMNATFFPATGSSIFEILLILTVAGTLLLSIIILQLPITIKRKVNQYLVFLYELLTKLIQKVLLLMPIALWSVITIFIKEINVLAAKSIFIYLICILLANVIQASIVLPLFLKYKQISTLNLFKAMLPALNVAFWTKSSGVALPVAINCATKNAKISNKIAQFSLPLCSTVNMNACAAFILLTVLFVSTSYGIVFTPTELVAWIIIATIAAIGNAGVPMGCFTLSTALLSCLNVPIYVMGFILPFYMFIDMIESAINVWSDSCVTAIVEKEIQKQTMSEYVQTN